MDTHTTRRPPPVPADAHCHRWRLGIDAQQHRAMAASEQHPPLVSALRLMMQVEAWNRVPLASLPNNTAVLAGMVGLPVREFEKLRPMLLGDWWPATDGRLYHDGLLVRAAELLHVTRCRTTGHDRALWRRVIERDGIYCSRCRVVLGYCLEVRAGRRPEDGARAVCEGCRSGTTA